LSTLNIARQTTQMQPQDRLPLTGASVIDAAQFQSPAPNGFSRNLDASFGKQGGNARQPGGHLKAMSDEFG
jgi:hypothetical protein